MDEELKNYIASGKAEQHFKLLVGAIRKGSWDYPEDKLERELKAINLLSGKSRIFSISLYVMVGFGLLILIASLATPFLIDRPLDIATFFIGGIMPILAFILKASVAANAKKFINHVHKLEAGGIKT